MMAMAKHTGWLASLLVACIGNGVWSVKATAQQSTQLTAELVSEQAEAAMRPNVLFLAVDDMRDWVNCLGGYPGTVHTPHIDRLAAEGMLFTNAHCASPKCAPSRAAIMTGLRPSTTGLYDNDHWWYPNLPDAVSIPSHFRAAGYQAVGAGKIFHHTAGNHPPNQWDHFQRLTFRDDPWFRGDRANYPWSQPGPAPKGFPLSGVPGLGHENDWGSLDIADHDYEDAASAQYAIDFLKRNHDRPFFLACGLFRPHLPWYVPKQYFDLYPIDAVTLPTVPADDLADLPPEGVKFATAKSGDLKKIMQADQWKQAVRAYLASISFADAQLGRVLEALNESEFSGNTVIVLWSDHGWHLGEKQHWHKSTLWEAATRVPLIIGSPQHAPGVCDRPVSLLDLFPTLVELCQLPPISDHDGVSLVPLLSDPSKPWRPAVIEFQHGNAAVRSDRYRYIRYRNGGEELYDHQEDPNEWTNLASSRSHARVKHELATVLNYEWAEPAATKKDFHFDPDRFQWTHRHSGETFEGSQP